MGDEEQVSSIWCSTTSLHRSADADSLATEREEAAILSLITSQFAGHIWHQDCNETEVTGGENFEGKGMLSTADHTEPQGILPS